MLLILIVLTSTLILPLLRLRALLTNSTNPSQQGASIFKIVILLVKLKIKISKSLLE